MRQNPSLNWHLRSLWGAAPLAFCLCVCLNATDSRAAVVAKLNQGQSLMLVAIGTSVTSSTFSSWFEKTGDWLNDLYPDKIAYTNLGTPSAASKYTATYTYPPSGLDEQLPWALNNLNPDTIFIEFAINDAYLPYGISLQDSKDNLQTMIDQINDWGTVQRKSVDIIVQTMNNDPYSGLRPNLASYYQGYRDVAAANGVLLIDNEPNWVSLYQKDPAKWRYYVPDTIHPDTPGVENIILPNIQNALLSQVPEPRSAVLLVTAGMMLVAGSLFSLFRKSRLSRNCAWTPSLSRPRWSRLLADVVF